MCSQHLHLNVPAEDVIKAKNWYVKNFGAIAGKRWHYEAADLPGINLNFSAAKAPVAPTRGRLLDHISFEVEQLETFCRKLSEQGIVFDTAAEVSLSGVNSVFLTDPWGTYIELTERLKTAN